MRSRRPRRGCDDDEDQDRGASAKQPECALQCDGGGTDGQRREGPGRDDREGSLVDAADAAGDHGAEDAHKNAESCDATSLAAARRAGGALPKARARTVAPR